MPQVMQKVAAIFLMYEAHRPEPLTSNPLAPFLAELVQVQGMEEEAPSVVGSWNVMTVDLASVSPSFSSFLLSLLLLLISTLPLSTSFPLPAPSKHPPYFSFLSHPFLSPLPYFFFLLPRPPSSFPPRPSPTPTPPSLLPLPQPTLEEGSTAGPPPYVLGNIEKSFVAQLAAATPPREVCTCAAHREGSTCVVHI